MSVITFSLRPGGQELSGDPPQVTHRYVLAGIYSAAVANAWAIAGTPTFVDTTYGLLFRQDVKLSNRGHKLWHVDVPYARQKKEGGDVRFDFDTSGATVRINHAKQHVETYPVDSDDDPHKGLIGVHDGNVEGADIIIPALRINYTFHHPRGVINEATARNLARVTGMTNSQPWRSFAAGELLFIGARGSDGSNAEAEVSYSFIASENASGLNIGDIAGIAKKGHDYLWIEYTDEVADDGPVMRPRRVHVERVYDEIDYAIGLGWS